MKFLFLVLLAALFNFSSRAADQIHNVTKPYPENTTIANLISSSKSSDDLLKIFSFEISGTKPAFMTAVAASKDYENIFSGRSATQKDLQIFGYSDEVYSCKVNAVQHSTPIKIVEIKTQKWQVDPSSIEVKSLGESPVEQHTTRPKKGDNFSIPITEYLGSREDQLSFKIKKQGHEVDDTYFSVSCLINTKCNSGSEKVAKEICSKEATPDIKDINTILSTYFVIQKPFASEPMIKVFEKVVEKKSNGGVASKKDTSDKTRTPANSK